MTLFKPFIGISKLIVVKNGKRVYDQSFSKGVNIIRGENSSGKTTITDFIFFILGGEIKKDLWREESVECDTVYAEMFLNDSKATVKRHIEEGKKFRPLHIYWDEFEVAVKSDETGWEVYPYSSTQSKLSFTQVLFNALDIPQVKGELSSYITMHQLLRLIYVDQLTPYDQLFRSEYFDKHIIREAIGEFLCGVYNDELYDLETKIAELTNESSEIKNKLENIFSVLGDVDRTDTKQFLTEKREKKIQKRRELYRSLENFEVKKQENEDEEKIDSLQKNLKDLKNDIATQKSKIDQLDFEIVDSKEFIESLDKKIDSIEKSEFIQQETGQVFFHICPACFSKIDETDGNEEKCHLCGATDHENGKETYLLKVKQELIEQKEESLQLIEIRNEERSEFAQRLDELLVKKETIQDEYRNIIKTLPTERDAQLNDIYHEIGHLDKEIEHFTEKINLAGRIEELQNRKAEIAEKLSKFNDRKAELQIIQAKRSEDAFTSIAKNTIELLQADLPREEVFQNPETVNFDFGNDSINVNRRSNFAASSMVILKNSFHLSLLISSTTNEYFRYPRFILMDNIEDKGMELERSQNFQRLIVSVSESLDVDHQIIFTTSMIDDELNNSDYVVGPFYTHENRALNLM
ncbi:MAG: AAA family ATPase [Balneolaceae bacterium]|nr:AAA family ATPase [Balneolaceae bacterium]MDR9408685.1 AAA family ATPase [Balneolaceae bacterium]